MANDRAPYWADLRAAATEDLTPTERAATGLAQKVIQTGSLAPLIEAVQAGAPGPEHAGEALKLVIELDLDLLVKLAVDALADQG